jgi:hypothetical protein
MADLKISQLTAITTLTPATDVLPVVDVGGVTKKITTNQILGSGGTATLASATITGDLTVDTNVLKVDSTNNRVGVGTASPSGIFHAANLGTAGTSADNFNGYFSSANRNANLYLLAKNTEGSNFYFGDGDSNTVGAIVYDHTSNYMRFDVNGAEQMRLNSTGLGVGVTPSAWSGSFRSLDIGSGTLTSQPSQQTIGLFANTFENGTNYTRKALGTAAGYSIYNGAHYWLNAVSGAAASTFSFGDAKMTLDASGRLFVGKTSSSAANTGCELQTGTGGNAASVFTADAGSASIMNRLTSDGTIIDFRRETLSVGNIAVTTLATTYNSISDYRLKEDVQPLVGGLARVSALKPSIYKWKVNGSDGEGFLAHELASVVSAAVTGEKDAVNEDGSINAQSIDMSRIVPILVAAIQELTAEVNALKNA